MYPFLETIKIDHGQVRNLEFHQQRMDKTIRDMYQVLNPILLSEQITCPAQLNDQVVKCRVLYDLGSLDTSFESYFLKEKIFFRVVHVVKRFYPYKYTDRSVINDLMLHKQACDDIIIVVDRMLTDSSVANLVFRKNKSLYTPEQPLLRGTKRQSYIDQGRIRPRKILVSELQTYDAFKCINAMMDLEDTDWLPVSNIIF
ncbi:MAG TPA: aminotransferase class IV [Saprospiraceae bacterium]|nr:hypothetical protein [Saprospirales bacterium]HRQ31439.1 aminotransferase class IV [Saprospiraceae bacterium]